MGYQKFPKSALEELFVIVFCNNIASRKRSPQVPDLPAYEHIEGQLPRWRFLFAETRPLLLRGWHKLVLNC